MAIHKEPILENDLILVHIQNQPAFFARIEQIAPDTKKNWWQVTLLALQLPVQHFTWLLDDNQIQGEAFTMGGIPVRIEKVIPPPLESKAPAKIRELKTTPEENSQETKAPKSRPTKATQSSPARILTMNPNKSGENDE
jgi:hypothetical protein